MQSCIEKTLPCACFHAATGASKVTRKAHPRKPRAGDSCHWARLSARVIGLTPFAVRGLAFARVMGLACARVRGLACARRHGGLACGSRHWARMRSPSIASAARHGLPSVASFESPSLKETTTPKKTSSRACRGIYASRVAHHRASDAEAWDAERPRGRSHAEHGNERFGKGAAIPRTTDRRDDRGIRRQRVFTHTPIPFAVRGLACRLASLGSRTLAVIGRAFGLASFFSQTHSRPNTRPRHARTYAFETCAVAGLPLRRGVYPDRSRPYRDSSGRHLPFARGGAFEAEKIRREPFPLAAPRGLTGGSTPKGGWGLKSPASGDLSRSERGETMRFHRQRRNSYSLYQNKTVIPRGARRAEP